MLVLDEQLLRRNLEGDLARWHLLQEMAGVR